MGERAPGKVLLGAGAAVLLARDGSGDQYAQQAKFFRDSFEREMDRAQPITDVKGTGRGFRWARG
jgi:hypothetical protein